MTPPRSAAELPPEQKDNDVYQVTIALFGKELFTMVWGKVESDADSFVSLGGEFEVSADADTEDDSLASRHMIGFWNG